MAPLVSVITASSTSGAQAVTDLLTKYSGKVRVRGCYRTQEKATPVIDQCGRSLLLSFFFFVNIDRFFAEKGFLETKRSRQWLVSTLPSQVRLSKLLKAPTMPSS
jgi:hypothetical protein